MKRSQHTRGLLHITEQHIILTPRGSQALGQNYNMYTLPGLCPDGFRPLIQQTNLFATRPPVQQEVQVWQVNMGLGHETGNMNILSAEWHLEPADKELPLCMFTQPTVNGL